MNRVLSVPEVVTAMELEPPNYCWICTKPILTASNFRRDDYGFRVHEECYTRGSKDKAPPPPSKG